TTAIDKVCLAGDPVLSNYPGGDIDGAVYAQVDSDVGGLSAFALGSADLDGDKAKTKCIEGIAKNRTAIVNGIIKNSVKCQNAKDKAASTFGAIDPTCIDAGTAAITKGAAGIAAACGSLTGTDVGSCNPLPTCVTDEAKVVGQRL